MIGARLGRWVLESELGRGGMGVVYLARAENGERAAVKVLAQELTTHTGAVSRFRREIDVLSQLDHPNIVRLLESGEHEGLLYYVMEYIEGRDFADLVRAQGRLPWNVVLDMAVDVSAALKHAHVHGVIHRDIKPSNLIRGADGRVKLADFGVAHVFQGEHLTRPGSVVGTAEYLSPEQAAGKPATRRSDLYSLGVVLYTLLTGRNPFVGPSIVDVLHKHRYAQFDAPAKIVPDLPPDLDEVVRHLMEKEPDKRPPDAGVLQRRLEGIRAKLAYRGGQTFAGVSTSPTLPGQKTALPSEEDEAPPRGEGEATMVSRIVRRELERQNRGGPVRRFLNRPLVLVALFVLCVAGLAKAFWPDDPEKLYREGTPYLTSADEAVREQGWDNYLKKLHDNFPDNPHRDEVAAFGREVERRRQARVRRNKGWPSEAQWFYQQGVRYRQQGDEAKAAETWRNLIDAFRDDPQQHTWVTWAEEELQAGVVPYKGRWDTVQKAVERARKLRDEGKGREADAVLDALEKLYGDDPSARDVLAAARGPR